MPAVSLSDVLTFCPIPGCVRALGTQKLMQAHLNEHAAGNITGFMFDREGCPRCGRWFKSAESLKAHRVENRRCAW